MTCVKYGQRKGKKMNNVRTLIWKQTKSQTRTNDPVERIYDEVDKDHTNYDIAMAFAKAKYDSAIALIEVKERIELIKREQALWADLIKRFGK
jgi:hypothetical protein